MNCNKCNKIFNKETEIIDVTDAKFGLKSKKRSYWCWNCIRSFLKQKLDKERKQILRGFQVTKNINIHTDEDGKTIININIKYTKKWYSKFVAFPTFLIISLLLFILFSILAWNISSYFLFGSLIYPLITSLIIFNNNKTNFSSLNHSWKGN